jgi:RND family efflux transporter MFP subunit
MLRKKTFWIWFSIVLVVVAGGGAAYYRYACLPSEEVPEPTITTAQVSRGDLVISVSGSGTLLPSVETDLGFQTSGYVSEVLVEVGDRVQAGDLLARLETDDLQVAVLKADIKLRLAKLNLDDVLEEPSDSERVAAEAAVKSAEAALAVSQYAYASAQNSDLDAAARARHTEFLYAADQFHAEEQTRNLGGNNQDAVDAAWDDWASTEAAFNQAVHEAEMEELEVANDLDQAQNRLCQARESLELLNTGPTTDTILQAELSVDQAALALEDARDDLDAAELRTPSDGTVVGVTAVPGQHVGTGAVVTLADLQEPVLQFWVEESDVSGVVVGNRLDIFFEALPELTFGGQVMRVDPALVEIGNTLALQAWASVDVASQGVELLGGMNADVEVIAAEARDVLLVPLQALRELANGQYGVFVVKSDGELELRLVEVGLRDFVNAEVVSGLEAGEVVSTGVAETVETPVQPEGQPQMPGPGMRFFGG